LTFEYELFATTENKLILNVDKEKLKAAPGFDPDAKRLDFATGLGETAFTTTTATPRLEAGG
jgi:hypothetical protein